MDKIYDLIIIGAGPTGLSAGIYAGRAKLDVLILEKNSIGGQVKTTSDIANYPGLPNVTGPKLMEEMQLQAKNFGVQFSKTEVTDVDFTNDVKIIKTNMGEYKGRAAIIATGASPRRLGFPGEEEFTGKGVAYCSTCDGEFFQDLDVFVIGAGFAAAEEAIFLTRFAKKVTVIAREPEFTCSKTIADKVLSHEKIEVKFNTEILKAGGEGVLNYAEFINNITKETFEYHASPKDGIFGIFVFVGNQPKTELFKEHVSTDKFGYILTDEHMSTNVPGIYAAGDLRPKDLRQIVTAVSDGAIAATSAERYITELKERLGIKDLPNHNITNAPDTADKSTHDSNLTESHNKEFLSKDIKNQLKDIFSRLEKNVTLVSIVDLDNPKSIELKNVLLEIGQLSEKINVEIYEKHANPIMEEKIHADKFPVVSFLDHEGNYSGVKFHGVPGGHELNSFVLAIYNLGSKGQPLSSQILEKIKSIDKKTNIKVAVSLSCHLCPDVVVNAQRIAIENPNVEAEMIDLSNFQELKTSYKLMSVPAIIINNETVHFGSKNIEELIDIINS
ncbi:MAG: FAD-dependent oxidoreductase [Clostridiaceae bacterium]